MASETESCSNPLVCPITRICLRTIFFSRGVGGMEGSTATFWADPIAPPTGNSQSNPRKIRMYRKSSLPEVSVPDGFDIVTKRGQHNPVSPHLPGARKADAYP